MAGDVRTGVFYVTTAVRSWQLVARDAVLALDCRFALAVTINLGKKGTAAL